MKKKFLTYSIGRIKETGQYDDEKLEEIAYGLETIYLTVTKLVVIFGVAFILGIVKEVITLLICYNIIRSSAYGLHASKSIYCLISSLILFIGGVYVSIYLASIPLIVKIILSLLSIIMIMKYAPADTEKRPLINSKKRKRFKIVSTIKGVIYLILIIYFDKMQLSGFLLVGLIEAIIMIHPIVYKTFNLPYDNYKNYNYGV